MKSSNKLIFFLSNAWKTAKGYVLISAITNIFQALLSFGNIVGIGMIVDALLSKQTSTQVFTLIILFSAVNLAISVIKEGLKLVANYLMRKTTNQVQYMYARDSVNVNYHFAQDGTILDLKKKSLGANPAFYIDHLGDVLRYIIQFFSVFAVVLRFSPMFMLILMGTSAISVCLIFQTKKDDYNFQNEKVKDDRKLDYLYQIMTQYRYAKEVRINRAEEYTTNKYEGVMRTQIRKLKVLFRKRMIVNASSTLIAVVQTAAMYLYFSFLAFENDISIAEYTVLLGSTTLFITLILGFFEKVAILNRTCHVLEYYSEYQNTLVAHSDIFASNALPNQSVDLSNIVVRFENVSFTYPGAKKTVLNHINLTLRLGDKIGLVGLNGSGKTTFVKLLIRLYDPTEGRITINGIDIKTIPHQQYLSSTGIVLQDYYLFAYSVKENVILNAPYDEKKLISCFEKSGADKKIRELKKGIDTSISKTLDEEGIELSGGEGQKLALARAIYKDAPILILDEPTSAMDPIAEYDLFMRLNDISKDKLTLFISHRLSSTKFCDRIIVLSDGKIIESGNHDALISKGGLYCDLFTSQAKYYMEVENYGENCRKNQSTL